MTQLSTKELANILGVTQRAVTKRLQGDGYPFVTSVKQFGRSYVVTVKSDWLDLIMPITPKYQVNTLVYEDRKNDLLEIEFDAHVAIKCKYRVFQNDEGEFTLDLIEHSCHNQDGDTIMVSIDDLQAIHDFAFEWVSYESDTFDKR